MFGFSSLRCVDCEWLDKDDKKNGEYYCPKARDYVSPSSHTCRDFEPNYYVMTAYCDIKNLPYNCDEMLSLIALRDTYMINNMKGKEFLEEYDIIGKELSERLRSDIYRTDIVDEMGETYIYPAMEMVRIGDFNEAQESFIEMIESLKVRYGYSPIKKSNDKVKNKDFKF